MRGGGFNGASLLIREQAVFAGLTTSSSPFAWLSSFLGNFVYAFGCYSDPQSSLLCCMRHSNACSDFSQSLSTGKERKTEGIAVQFCKLKRWRRADREREEKKTLKKC